MEKFKTAPVGIKYMISVMQAFDAGKKIQVKRQNDSDEYYTDTADAPKWDWSEFHYRVKPDAPKPTPFDFESMPFPAVVRTLTEHKTEYNVITRNSHSVIIATSSGNEFVSYQRLAEIYEWQSLSSAIASNKYEKVWKPCTKESLK